MQTVEQNKNIKRSEHRHTWFPHQNDRIEHRYESDVHEFRLRLVRQYNCTSSYVTYIRRIVVIMITLQLVYDHGFNKIKIIIQ